MSLTLLNDECSDAIEKSISVRSGSEDSLLCEEDDPEDGLARQLLDALAPAALSKLRRAFRKTKERSRSQDIDRRVEEVMRQAAAEEGIEFAPAPATTSLALSLDRDAFVHAINNIFGHHKFEPHAQALFQQLDAWGAGRVWWRQLLERLLAGASTAAWAPLTDVRVKQLSHCKRETIVKLVPIETRDSFCYAAVSKGGRVGLYDGHLKLLHSYEVFYHRTGVHKRIKNCWITDAIYMSDVQSLLLTASDRSLTVYDASTLAHALTYCVTGLPHIPTCVAYLPSGRGSPWSELALGTARGDITRMRFLRPRLALLQPAPDHVARYFWTELSSASHKNYCSISTWRRVHARAVRRVCYSGDVVFSCSHDSCVSVRARHAPGKLDDYIFKVQRGVSCFHVVPALHLLATGGPDGAVRLWDTTQSNPFARLATPARAAVLDVKVVADMEVVLAYCSNCWLHIWDLNEECLLQTIKIKFPFLGVLGKKVEFGAYCIHPGPALQKTIEEESPSTSRGSSVVRGRSGGLQLLEEEEVEPKDLRDIEYTLSHRASVLVSCCDCVCAVRLAAPAEPRPAPGDSLRARRPHAWDIPDHASAESASPRRVESPRGLGAPRSPGRRSRSPRAPTPRKELLQELPPAPVEDLDKLLEYAGLKGILEKDFVLMKGLKHDLNMKLAEMEANREAMAAAVLAGAPHLALRTYDAPPLAPVDEMADVYARAMSQKTVRRLLECRPVASLLAQGYSQEVDELFKFYSDEPGRVDLRPLTEDDYDRFISRRAARREPALTRQITSLAYGVGRQMISLAEGMPNEEVFPIKSLEVGWSAGGTLHMEGKELATALQYIPSQGLPALLNELRSFQEELHRPPPLPRDIIVTNGGQHGIYQAIDLLLDEGDPVLIANYCYTGVHVALKPYKPEIISIPEDALGLVPERLEQALSERRARGLRMPRLLCLTPTANNPTGTTLPEGRRRKIYDLACEYDFLILEDDPYMFLNYEEECIPSFLSLDVAGRVIRLDSLSKVVSSGLRGGWLSAPRPLLRRAELHMQSEVLHSCSLAQCLVHHIVANRSGLAAHLRRARALYRRRRDALLAALEPLAPLADWHVPSGGLFLWLRVRGVDDVYNMVFETAFKRGLMLLPGQAFQHDTSAPSTHLRLTFSKIAFKDMPVAARLLADIIREEQQRCLQKQPQRLATQH